MAPPGPEGQVVARRANRRCWSSLETASPSTLREIQEEALPRRIEQAYREAPLYQELWSAQGVTPASIRALSDLGRLPLVTKDMVRDFRRRTGDPFGGMAGPVRPGSVVSSSTGTSGEPTYFVTSPGDVDRAADEVASYLWQIGNRPGDVVVAGVGSGTRADAPMRRASEMVGLVSVLVDQGHLDAFLAEVDYLQPKQIGLTTGSLDRLVSRVTELGKDFEQLFSAVCRVAYAGRRLPASERRRIAEVLNVEVFEVGGLGDIGLWMSDCEAHDAMHLREDFFVVETIDPKTAAPVAPGEFGELVFTSLWESSMNYVRWRSEDLGVVTTEPCRCGRTTARIRVFGRVWERVTVGRRSLFPADVEEVLLAVFGKEPLFQLVKRRGGTELVAINLALADAGVGDARRALAEALGVEVPIRVLPEDEILAGSPGYKYRQVLDE